MFFFLKTPHYDDHQILNIQNDCTSFFYENSFQDIFSLFTYAVLAQKNKCYPRHDNFYDHIFCKYEFPIVRSAKKSNKKNRHFFGARFGPILA